MTEAKGTQEFKDLIDLSLAVVELGFEVAKDKKVDFNDIAAIMKVLPFIEPAFSNIGDVPGELSDLSAEEASELVIHVMARLSVDDAKAKAIVDKSLGVLLAGYKLVQAIRA